MFDFCVLESWVFRWLDRWNFSKNYTLHFATYFLCITPNYDNAWAYPFLYQTTLSREEPISPLKKLQVRARLQALCTCRNVDHASHLCLLHCCNRPIQKWIRIRGSSNPVGFHPIHLCCRSKRKVNCLSLLTWECHDFTHTYKASKLIWHLRVHPSLTSQRNRARSPILNKWKRSKAAANGRLELHLGLP